MTQIAINDTIIVDPAVCHGQPVFRGTRIMVWQVLELLETGMSRGDIMTSYPTLPKDAIAGALSYAAKKICEASYVPFATKASL